MEVANLKKVEIPFTLYDFFGYLLPGVIFGAFTMLSSDLPIAIEFLRLRILGRTPPVPSPFILNDFLQFLHTSPVFISILGLLLAYIVGHIIAALSSYFLERILVQSWLGYPTQNMFAFHAKKNPTCFRNFRRSYSDDFVAKFRSAFESTFNLEFKSTNDVFWVTFEFIAHNCPATFARSMHFLNLYGFSRNLSMTFILSGGVLLVFAIAGDVPIQFAIIIGCFAIALVLYWNYLKLLRRLNDEIYRGFYSYVTTSK